MPEELRELRVNLVSEVALTYQRVKRLVSPTVKAMPLQIMKKVIMRMMNTEMRLRLIRTVTLRSSSLSMKSSKRYLIKLWTMLTPDLSTSRSSTLTKEKIKMI